LPGARPKSFQDLRRLDGGDFSAWSDIPADAVKTTQRQIEEYQRFRGLGKELVEANEQLCDAQLAACRTLEGTSNGRGVGRIAACT
jgi:hypothetical protein